MREIIWKTLCDLRFRGYYIALLIEKYQKRERILNIILAIASSGSIAAWAVWQKFPFVWGSIIALSQVITVIKPYLPYAKYVKELNPKCTKLDYLNLEFEMLFYKIQNDKIDEDAVEHSYRKLSDEILKVLNFSDELIITTDKSLENMANIKMKYFLRTQYNININF
jgi:hypothetical protein